MFKWFKKEDKKERTNFITAKEAKKIADEFINDKKNDENTLKLIKDIENLIVKMAKSGYKNCDYTNYDINCYFNEDMLKKHFRDNEYTIGWYHLSNDGSYLHIILRWD